MAGGNSHQRALQRATKNPPKEHNKQSTDPPTNATQAVSIYRNPGRLSLGDSVGFAGILLGVLLVVVVPPLWIKIPMMVSVCVGTFLFVRHSYWTNGWPPINRYLGASIFCVVFLVTAIPQFISQWKQEHSSFLSISAAIAPTYPAGHSEYGIKWEDGTSNVRLTVTDLTDYPVRSFDLTVKVLEKTGDILVGMGQASDIAGCEFHGPRWPEMSLDLHGANGKNYRLPMPDSELSFGAEWKGYCPTLPAGLPLKLVVAVSNEKQKWKEPEKFRLYGSYEVVSDSGSRVIAFNRVVNVGR